MAVTHAELVMLAETGREWVTENCPAKPVYGHDAAVSAERWKTLSELGWPGAALAEKHGGAGFGWAGLGALLTALGRELVASPLLSSALVAEAIRLGGSDAVKAALLPALVSGEAVGAVAIFDGANHNPSSIQTTATAVEGGEWLRLDGIKRYVVDARAATHLLVAARGVEGIALYLVETKSLLVQPLDTVDARDFGRLTIDGLLIPSLAAIAGGHLMVSRLCDLARIGLAAEMIGAAERSLELTIEYLQVREQFGRKIGSFQALQHRAAKMHVDLELARSCVNAALRAADEELASLPEAALLAKAMAGEAMHLISNEVVQLHGGIGMTEEHVAGRYLKWSRVTETLYGGGGSLADQYAQLKGY